MCETCAIVSQNTYYVSLWLTSSFLFELQSKKSSIKET